MILLGLFMMLQNHQLSIWYIVIHLLKLLPFQDSLDGVLRRPS